MVKYYNISDKCCLYAHSDGTSCQADPERGDTIRAVAHRLPRHRRRGPRHLPRPVKLRVHIHPGLLASNTMSTTRLSISFTFTGLGSTAAPRFRVFCSCQNYLNLQHSRILGVSIEPSSAIIVFNTRKTMLRTFMNMRNCKSFLLFSSISDSPGGNGPDRAAPRLPADAGLQHRHHHHRHPRRPRRRRGQTQGFTAGC